MKSGQMNKKTPAQQENNGVDYKYEYETAIKARNSHYKNFNYWANFYAIIIGALFIAFYTIVTTTSEKGALHYSMLCIIAFMGSAMSFAWLQVIRGHYHWLKSWTNVVLYYEDKKVSKNKSEDRVYSLFYDEENSGCCLIESKNISTQKITIRAVLLLYIAWVLLLIGFMAVFYNEILAGKSSIAIMILFIIALIFALLFPLLIFNCKVKSNIDYHYQLKKNNSKSVYDVYPPEK